MKRRYRDKTLNAIANDNTPVEAFEFARAA